ncbi:MAG TPA: phosphodiester glycosidase family protein [Ignavibacteriales bacterium]|nr:phosphodiester glycosidase family protein [Ignavibacteriales bacterium]HOL80756.1 phosphodiester glycosidase family protein [Ignavibacteriales bacterium]HOM66003.1 phosphodiester glycosidase family protein [Ignavibacteriales bacterium]HPD67763.1 phosphodiester glycosidase family protein [Ignavibacteriales bacterium]HPP33192.1 phosphodiester glycosidase family protein [Ignavibacteriales bacterium]
MLRILIFLFTSLLVFSQVTFDTISALQVGPDMYYYKMVNSSKPWSMDVFKVKLTTPYVKIEAVKAKDKITGYEPTPTSATRKQKPNYYPVAAINGDFYSSTETIGFQINQGEVVKMPGSFSVIGFDYNNKPFINRITSLSGKIIKNNLSYSIHGVNKSRATDQIIIYNRFFNSPSTQTNMYGTECLVKLLPGQKYSVNDTMKCVVIKKEYYVGNMNIDNDCFVISGHGAGSTWLNNNISINDTIKVILNIATTLKQIKEVIGAYPKIVFNGQNYANQGVAEEGGPSHAPDRHPRSAAGISQDSTFLYLIVVDGRNPHSIGMTLNELAEFMLKIGVYHGVNFDGGGSSCLVVNNQVKNVPSDGSPRSVANSLVIFSTVEPTNIPFNFKFEKKLIKLFRTHSTELKIFANDIHGFPSQFDNSKVKFACDSAIGNISNNIFTSKKSQVREGYIYLYYDNQLKDSCKIVIKYIKKLSFSTKNFITDTSKTNKILFKFYDSDGVQQNINYQDVKVTIINPENLKFDINTGIIKFIKPGYSKIIFEIDDAKDTINVNCLLKYGNLELLNFNSSTQFNISKNEVDTAIANIVWDNNLQKNVLKIHYYMKGKVGISQSIFVNVNYPIEGIADSLFIFAKSDNKKHHIKFYFEDDNQELFRNNTLSFFDKPIYQNYPIAFKNMSAVSGGIFYYPVTLKQIQVELLFQGKVNDSIYTGDLYFDKIDLVYPKDITSIDKFDVSNKEYILFPNYPNPFNPTTKIQFYIPQNTFLEFNIYNSMGQLVDKINKKYYQNGLHSFTYNANNLPSGVYFLRMEGENINKTIKLMLVK